MTGFIAFAGSALLDGVLHVSLADQLVLAFITGGVTLLVQYLAEFEQRLGTFEQRLSASEAQQRQALAEFGVVIQQGFAGVSEATVLRNEIEKSALDKDGLKQVLRRAGGVTDISRPLVRRLADSEVARLSGTLRSLASGHELLYDGEDREYLLALTRQTQRSIMATATAWTTVNGLDIAFWFTDLAARYLDLQRDALARGVEIKRLFIFESPDLAQSVQVTKVLAVQRKLGIRIKLLDAQTEPGAWLADGPISDIVIFDEEISHETSPVARREESGALATRLLFDQDAVRGRVRDFQGLWDQAVSP